MLYSIHRMSSGLSGVWESSLPGKFIRVGALFILRWFVNECPCFWPIPSSIESDMAGRCLDFGIFIC